MKDHRIHLRDNSPQRTNEEEAMVMDKVNAWAGCASIWMKLARSSHSWTRPRAERSEKVSSLLRPACRVIGHVGNGAA